MPKRPSRDELQATIDAFLPPSDDGDSPHSLSSPLEPRRSDIMNWTEAVREGRIDAEQLERMARRCRELLDDPTRPQRLRARALECLSAIARRRPKNADSCESEARNE